MEREDWNKFIKEHGPLSGSFLQSWEWGEFQQSLGRKVIKISDNDFAAQIIKIPLGCGLSYFYIPKGPILKKFPISLPSGDVPQGHKIQIPKQPPHSPPISPEAKQGEAEGVEIRNVLKYLIDVAKKENAVFIRFEPEILDENESKNLNLWPSPASQVQPRQTIIFDLEKPFDDLLRGMHPKTRYNIHLAERHGIEIRVENKFGNFLRLLKETSGRDNFFLHPDNYYKKMFEILASTSDFNIKPWVAKSKGQIIAVAMIGYFGKTATYLHGGSAHNYRSLMAPHLLHWAIIKDAKVNGFKYYDFWGIDEKKWPGVTRFKKGFSGEELNFPGAFDLPIRKNLYRIYMLTKRLRQIF